MVSEAVRGANAIAAASVTSRVGAASSSGTTRSPAPGVADPTTIDEEPDAPTGPGSGWEGAEAIAVAGAACMSAPHSLQKSGSALGR